MDTNSLFKALRDPGLLADIPVPQVEELVTHYPWFAGARLLQFASKKNTGKSDLALVALYKQDPLLFAQFIDRCNRPVEVVQTPTEDILELINGIPNSNPIEITAFQSNKDPETGMKAADTSKPPSREDADQDADQSLMVMKSFTDWLQHFKHKAEREREEEKDKKRLRTAWQKEKLAAAIEEENDDIPEPIFRQAMDSISETGIVSEAMACILAKQGKKDKAIEMYRKLSLRNPEKSTYFADRIQELQTTDI